MKNEEIKFKEIEISVFALEPEVKNTHLYLCTREISQMLGFLNYLEDHENKDNFYLYSKCTVKISEKEFTFAVSRKLSNESEKIEHLELMFKEKKYCNLEKIIEKIQKFNHKKVRRNRKRIFKEIEFLADLY